ncbi:HAD family hydrolase [Solihabitans fulvus]|uniref:HAD family hydrolase n=1 Tax=Solihabitans fulvus TaxID=1892852 RepID=UPI001CB75FC7|nr:HAD-IA family hydrolase [Solihabitans fulvus]
MLRRFAPDDPIEDAHGLPRGSLASAAFAPDVVGPAISGAVRDDAWRAATVARLLADVPGLAADAARAAVEAWNRPGEPIPAAVELVRQARTRCRVALLTNATSRLPEDLRRIGLDREVDAVVSSARIGVAKPAPEAFRRALRVLQHSPASTLFCDDSAVNAEAARTLGIDAAHVPDTDALRAALAGRGLLGERPAPGAAGPESGGVLLVLLVLPDRADAERIAATLAAEGWSPAVVHKDLLAGEDDVEDADWVVELATAPDGRPAAAHRPRLDALAAGHDGFTTGFSSTD